MKKLDLSIGILAWKNIKTLEKTLDTFLDNGLFDIVEDITIFFQEISKEDIEIINLRKDIYKNIYYY